jgi:hypothetical protein
MGTEGYSNKSYQEHARKKSVVSRHNTFSDFHGNWDGEG